MDVLHEYQRHDGEAVNVGGIHEEIQGAEQRTPQVDEIGLLLFVGRHLIGLGT